jgi:hypothetical protein
MKPRFPERNLMAIEPTEEQRAARDVFVAGRDLALVAGAGTGKTSTLMLMGASGLYVALNRARADGSRRRFGPNVACRTAHSLAYKAVGPGLPEPAGDLRLHPDPGDRPPSGHRPQPRRRLAHDHRHVVPVRLRQSLRSERHSSDGWPATRTVESLALCTASLQLRASYSMGSD